MMAYDSTRGKVVLFGGLMHMGGQPSDTWEWDGSAWQRVGNAQLINRYRGAMSMTAPGAGRSASEASPITTRRPARRTNGTAASGSTLQPRARASGSGP